MSDTPSSHAGETDAGPCGCADPSVQLLKSDVSWNGKLYDRYPDGRPQLTVVRFSIPPHTSLPWHTHPMPNAAYVISGQITLEERATGKVRTVHAGEAFAESVDDIHRGFTEDLPAEIVCTYAGVQGLPLSIQHSEAPGAATSAESSPGL